MDGKQKWTIADNVLKESFRTLGIDVLYFPLFKKDAIERLNDIAATYEPEQDDIDSSIELAGEWVKIYAEQIKLGLSKLWASTYADFKVSWSKDDSANEAYNKVCMNFSEEEANKDLAIFAKSLCDDPIFVQSYIDIFHDDFQDAEKRAHEYINLYRSLIEGGKSPVYAKQYALHYFADISPEYCKLYASKYEECINKGRDNDKAKIIATAYENLYEEYWPEDDNLLGIEAHNSYMKGFEYAIDNGIDFPATFAEEYEKAYLSTLFPDEKEPSIKIKGKYDDLFSKLLAEKV